MTAPSRGYHGVTFWETFGDFAFTMKARMEVLRVHGAALAPLSAVLLLQGIETLHIRWSATCRMRAGWPEFLSHTRRVQWWNWPGLPSSPYYRAGGKYRSRAHRRRAGRLQRDDLRYRRRGRGGVRSSSRAPVPSHLATSATPKSLVIHPASTTPGSCPSKSNERPESCPKWCACRSASSRSMHIVGYRPGAWVSTSP